MQAGDGHSVSPASAVAAEDRGLKSRATLELLPLAADGSTAGMRRKLRDSESIQKRFA